MKKVPVLFVMLAVLAIGCTGCQTFNLTKEEWEKQQRGEMVDRQMGQAIDYFGTLGWWGAKTGVAVGSAVR